VHDGRRRCEWAVFYPLQLLQAVPMGCVYSEWLDMGCSAFPGWWLQGDDLGCCERADPHDRRSCKKDSEGVLVSASSHLGSLVSAATAAALHRRETRTVTHLHRGSVFTCLGLNLTPFL